jgi:hypothetical protein
MYSHFLLNEAILNLSANYNKKFTTYIKLTDSNSYMNLVSILSESE